MSIDGLNINGCVSMILNPIANARKPRKKIKFIVAGEPIELMPIPKLLYVRIKRTDIENFTQYGLDEWVTNSIAKFIEKMPERIERYCELVLPTNVIAATRQTYNDCTMRAILDYKPGTDEQYLNFDLLYQELE